MLHDLANDSNSYKGAIPVKINKKYEPIVFTFLMALGMSCIISFFMILCMFGLRPDFLSTWLTTWAMAFAIAFPTAYVLPRGIRKAMQGIRFVENK